MIIQNKIKQIVVDNEIDLNNQLIFEKSDTTEVSILYQQVLLHLHMIYIHHLNPHHIHYKFKT